MSREAGHLAHRGDDLGGGDEPQLGDEAGGPHHPQRVVAEGDLRGGRRAQDPGREVVEAAVRVDEDEVGQPQGHRVAREVAADEVVLEGVAEGDDRLAGHPVVGVGPVGRHLDDGARRAGRRWCRRRGPCPRWRCPRRRGSARCPPGRRGGGEVEVGGGAAEERVADRPADEGEVVPGRGEALAEVGEHGQHGGDAARTASAQQRGRGLAARTRGTSLGAARP